MLLWPLNESKLLNHKVKPHLEVQLNGGYDHKKSELAETVSNTKSKIIYRLWNWTHSSPQKWCAWMLPMTVAIIVLYKLSGPLEKTLSRKYNLSQNLQS